MMYVKITRSESLDHYVVPASVLPVAIENEFDFIEDMIPGESFTLTVVEMDEAEYKKLPEFAGW